MKYKTRQRCFFTVSILLLMMSIVQFQMRPGEDSTMCLLICAICSGVTLTTLE